MKIIAIVILGMLAGEHHVAARPPSAPYIGEVSFEFYQNQTFGFRGPLKEVLGNAKYYDAQVTISYVCSAPIAWSFGKCDRNYYRQDRESSKARIVFDTAGVDTLLKLIEMECYEPGKDQEYIQFYMFPTEDSFTNCRFAVAIAAEPIDMENFTLFHLPGSALHLYEEKPPKIAETAETSEVSDRHLLLRGLIAISFFIVGMSILLTQSC
ncbi:Protein CBG15553 [Caenorhabditis briggsae]|uniref:Uncharacterized protein n=2 Tax=Caenorhabditis briggsae TaxID=6238 RepID=A0AAE8ZWR4_CAEBR|nr:Protein CBG15553 [Caenorhabditis briggsae]ULT83768.1 hypothetical protein L3Y34_012794 [Caenorhabditis briggsae]CAP33726.1 Protein CBG15553 [Caenorhabditis briggsae]